MNECEQEKNVSGDCLYDYPSYFICVVLVSDKHGLNYVSLFAVYMYICKMNYVALRWLYMQPVVVTIFDVLDRGGTTEQKISV